MEKELPVSFGKMLKISVGDFLFLPETFKCNIPVKLSHRFSYLTVAKPS